MFPALLLLLPLLGITSSFPIPDELPPSVRKSYSGYSLLRTAPIRTEDVATSLLVLDGMRGIHFWKYPLINTSTDILASPTQLIHIQSLLESLGVQHKIIIPDVEPLLRKTQENVDEDLNFFQRYQRYDAIMKFVTNLTRSDPRVTFESVGISSEGREIGLVTISSGQNKPGIWIDGGMHAREWISPATVLYILEKLIQDPSSTWMVDAFDWYIVPVINVDGYEFSHTGDRLWRKTRSRNTGPCVGVDPNRNFNFHWASEGASSDPCAENYHGPNAFSEPESLAIARAVKSRSNIIMYLSFHAYSQIWLVPFSYAKGARPDDYEELLRMANVGASALYATKFRTEYKVGAAPDLLYAAAGGSDDWAKGAAGIKYSYTLELRDTGTYGFILPPDQIIPSGVETFNAVAAVAKDLLQNMTPSPSPKVSSFKRRG